MLKSWILSATLTGSLLYLKEIYRLWLKEYNNIIEGRLEADKTVLLSEGAEGVRPVLLKNLADSQFLFNVYGDGKKSISCEKITIHSNIVYIYGNMGFGMSVCQNAQDNILATLANSVNIPLHMRMLGFRSLHIHFFGGCSDSFVNKIIEHVDDLPYDSTVIISTITNSMMLHATSLQLLIDSALHANNPYMSYIRTIVTSPEKSLFAVNTKGGVKIFTTNTKELINQQESAFLLWQESQILKFIDFSKELESKDSSIFYNIISNYPYNEKGSTYFFMELSNIRLSLLLYKYIVNDMTYEMIELINNNNIDLNAISLNGMAPIHIASFLGKIDSLKALVNFGIDVDILGHEKKTPLILASYNNQKEASEILLYFGADPYFRDAHGHNAIILAYLKNNTSLIEILLRNSCNYTNTKSLDFKVDMCLYYSDKLMIDCILENESNIGHVVQDLSYISEKTPLNDNYINLIKDCFVNLDYDKSYNNLLELCELDEAPY